MPNYIGEKNYEHGSSDKTGILLTNLGTPDAPTAKALKPYLKEFSRKINFNNFKKVDRIHFFGYYIGNYPSLKKSKIREITSILNKIDI